MIISFEFSNHHSYKDLQSFSMERLESLNHSKDSINAKKYKLKLSRVATIYGANASGKSGFITAFAFLQDAIKNGASQYNPFALLRNTVSSKSTYSINFIARNHIRYQYDLEYDDRGITYECLVIWDSQKPAKLFEGVRDEKKRTYTFGERFTSTNIRKIITKETQIGDHCPLLTFLGHLDEKVTLPVRDFFKKQIVCHQANEYGSIFRQSKKYIMKESDIRNTLSYLLPSIDLGIDGIDVVEPQSKIIELFMKESPDTDRQEIIDKYSSLMFRHSGGDINLRLSRLSESSGTIAATTFLLFAYDILQSGGVYIIDELDASLHPLLMSQLVEVFNDAKSNPNNAQLIFTTHDASLINCCIKEDNVLDRDQIWFTEKDQSGTSTLYPLTDIDTPREGINIGVKYLHGRYGAIPNISLVDKITNLMNNKR